MTAAAAIAALPAPKPRFRVRTDGVAYALPARADISTSPPAGWGGRGASGYMRGEQMPLFFHWHPALREANDDVRAAWRLATARTVNAIQNSGWLAGSAEQSAAHVVGAEGLELHAKPNAVMLKWSQADANDWARRVEARWSGYAGDKRAVDAGARFDLAQLCWQAYKHWMATGEILATLPWVPREGALWNTKLRVLPAWRLSLRSTPPFLINGVRLAEEDSWSPRSYLLWRLVKWGAREETELPAFDGYGRPLVTHIFDGEPDQVRGISPWTPTLKVTRQFDQLADATLTAALIQAVFAAMFTSPGPAEDVLEGLKSEAEQKSFSNLIMEKIDWYRHADLNLGVAGKILHGFPGDELEFKRSEHPNDNYEAFATFLLREISRVAALTYSEFTGDYTSETFSSAKMSTTANWPRILYRRKHLVAPLCQRVYEAWLEEDIETGGTPFPGGIEAFLAQRAAASQATWRGPPKPQPDDLKAAKALQALQELGVPDTVLFGELGLDVDDCYELRKREQDRREALGLKERTPAVADPRVTPPGAIEGDEPDGTASDGEPKQTDRENA